MLKDTNTKEVQENMLANTNTKIQKIQERCICLFQGLLVQLRVDAECQEEAIPEREKISLKNPRKKKNYLRERTHFSGKRKII